MTSKIRLHLRGQWLGTTLAMVALFVALGGNAIAEPIARSAAALVTGKQIQDSSVTTRDVKDRSLLANDFKAGQLRSGPAGASGAQGVTGASGADGAAGSQGQTGPQGTPATRLFANVAANGTVSASSGVTGAISTSPGLYTVTFDRDVSRCAGTASVGGFNGGMLSATIATVNRTGATPDPVLRVSTQRLQGAGFISEDHSFSLAVFC